MLEINIDFVTSNNFWDSGFPRGIIYNERAFKFDAKKLSRS